MITIMNIYVAPIQICSKYFTKEKRQIYIDFVTYLFTTLSFFFLIKMSIS